MRPFYVFLLALGLLVACRCTPAADNTLTKQEIKDGWELLWDGETTTGWRSIWAETFPEKGWEIKDGELIVLASAGAESANGGDIITVIQYRNFILDIDFKLTEGANSGIKYFVQTDLNTGAGSAIGCEWQILDDLRHPDAKLGKDGNRTLGSLYDLIPAPEDKPFHAGEFNTARVVVNNRHVEHWLNGTMLFSYERNNPEWETLVDGSKYVVWPNFGNYEQGHILLQDHGNEVHFKNIKIKQLP